MQKPARIVALVPAVALIATLLVGGPAASAAGPGKTAVAVGAGGQFTCGLTAKGAVKCWGYNGNGQLGNDSLDPSSLPVQVRKLKKGVVQITTGFGHACALKTDGTAMCWGYNGTYTLGDGTLDDRDTPVKVRGIAKVKEISAGASHTCALTRSGAVKCWGDNSQGQLGDGTNEPRNKPVQVKKLKKGVRAISAGNAHTCAINGKGAALCWGDNFYGQLGDGTKDERKTPTKVKRLAKGVTAIAAGSSFSCAIKGKKRAAVCWGRNGEGQLGNGTAAESLTPVQVKKLKKGTTAISASTFHGCAINGKGAALCWGYNLYGSLGDGTDSQRNAPVQVKKLKKGTKAISVGHEHTCAVKGKGIALCWGRNFEGQLGEGTVENSSTPVKVKL